MTDELDLMEPASEPVEELPPAPPINDRFLFVDVAALRAKQLRRGARPRLPEGSVRPEVLAKPERIAMEEVRRRLVYYDLPPVKGRNGEAASSQ